MENNSVATCKAILGELTVIWCQTFYPQRVNSVVEPLETWTGSSSKGHRDETSCRNLQAVINNSPLKIMTVWLFKNQYYCIKAITSIRCRGPVYSTVLTGPWGCACPTYCSCLETDTCTKICDYTCTPPPPTSARPSQHYMPQHPIPAFYVSACVIYGAIYEQTGQS